MAHFIAYIVEITIKVVITETLVGSLFFAFMVEKLK